MASGVRARRGRRAPHNKMVFLSKAQQQLRMKKQGTSVAELGGRPQISGPCGRKGRRAATAGSRAETPRQVLGGQGLGRHGDSVAMEDAVGRPQQKLMSPPREWTPVTPATRRKLEWYPIPMTHGRDARRYWKGSTRRGSKNTRVVLGPRWCSAALVNGREQEGLGATDRRGENNTDPTLRLPLGSMAIADAWQIRVR